jgi:octaprenyl-diphosphate synthase
LDIWGEERITGKSLGTDLEKQKLTLPVIRLLRVVEPEAASTIRRLLTEGKADHRRQLRPYLETSGALDDSWQCAKQHVKLALEALDCLADSDARSVLRLLAQYVVRRAS